ncbi:MAG: hypothetical protein KJ057_04220 [Phycisphaerae bacterium]|nr:MAG: hypothetical protein EDS66_07270 [Planctomycetota bacterium]KAB2948829.1 MAG: hypothetical protein F9K17_05025 [Phycisphaerae bacterium]MBE7455352.1 hypothetical protein [Planctomycetia bacterium]MCK6464164.1 hypothetical protein [Phycisphaerae bacterium]MCL4717662.1 hypothetical protein [Phycisphaerae bacterium]
MPELKEAPQRHRDRIAAWMSAIVALATYLALVRPFLPQINDDAFITFRYAKFLALGRGPYFNVGEPVEGYTNPLMVPLMALVWRIAGDDAVLPAAKGLGVLSGCAAVLAAGVLARRMLAELPRSVFSRTSCVLFGSAASLLTAINGAFLLNSTTGLETTLFAALVTAGLAAMAGEAVGRGRRWTGVLFALAALTRPEGVVVFVVAAGAEFLAGGRHDAARRRALKRDGLIVAGVVAAHLALRMILYDGELLPNTYYAKSGGMPERTPGGYLLGFARNHLGARDTLSAVFRLLLPAAAPLLMWIVVRLRREATDRTEEARAVEVAVCPTRAVMIAAPAACVTVFGVAAVFFTGPDWMPGYRLLAPYVPAASAAGVASAAGICASFAVRRASAWGLGALAACTAWLWSAQGEAVSRDLGEIRVRAEGYRKGHAELAAWLLSSARSGDVVALMDIGLVGFLNPDLRILDITGLTDRTIAHAPGPFLCKSFDPGYVFDQRPRFLILTLQAPLRPGGEDDFRNLKPFTPIEERLIEDPAFLVWYAHPREPAEEADLLERLACVTGAARVFRHDYPGLSYFLAAFERVADPAGLDGGG